MALTDANGDVTDTYSYDAWGKVTSHVDPDPNDGVGLTNDNPYQYVGQLGYYTHWQEQDFGLLQLGVRYYDPGIGRFISRDPVQHGWNWYAYVSNAPGDLTDPCGRKARGSAAKDPVVAGCIEVFNQCIKKGVAYGHKQFYVESVLTALERINDGDVAVDFGDLDGSHADANIHKQYLGWGKIVGSIRIDRTWWSNSCTKVSSGCCRTLLHELIHVGGTPADLRKQRKIEIQYDKDHPDAVRGPYEIIADDMWGAMGCNKCVIKESSRKECTD